MSFMEKIDKPWGHELIFAQAPGYIGKVLHVKSGEGLSLQYHNVKDETIWVQKGLLRLKFQQGSGPFKTLLLKKGDSFRIPPRMKHRMEAVEDCEILEVSTPQTGDVVRLEDNYGRALGLEVAVIMAGGEGTRLWPWSRCQRPKHLLNLLGDHSLLKETIKRVRLGFSPHQIFLITQKNQVKGIMEDLPELPGENIISEPWGRNTAPAAGLAAVKLREICGDAVMILLPADHYINQGDKLLAALKAASQVARQENALVVVGVKPTGPESGFGYLHLKDKLKRLSGQWVYSLDRFVEKPPKKMAESFLKQGGYLWNCGILVTPVAVLLEALKAHLPRLYAGLEKIGQVLGKANEEEVTARVYRRLQGMSLDYGILEKSKRVLAVAGNFAWSDVGCWQALDGLLGKKKSGNIIAARRMTIDTKDCLIYSPQKLVATLGIENLIVVETADSLLVCRKDRSQDVKLLVDRLRKQGLKEYL